MSTSGPTPPGTPQVKSLNCTHCGAALTLRSFGNAANIVCESCHSILDARDPLLKILQTFKAAASENPLIPLGSRGQVRGTPYEVIGFEIRMIEVEGIPYSWGEYVLFNPYKGFRYLTEYNGHWNDTSILRSLPDLSAGGSSLTYLGETYKHFQSAEAKTTSVLGEFPWQVRVGESASVSDYVSPPRVISRERTKKEVTWSMGEYMTGGDIWRTFGLPGSAPSPIGVYENQPSLVSRNMNTIWVAFGVLAVVLVGMLLAFSILARNEHVFDNNYTLDTNVRGEASFVTEVFEIKGHTSAVEVTTSSDVDNNWIYVNYALINQDTGQAYDFGREISYYHGYDDGYWSEGTRTDSVTIPTVPPGNYYLRVEPEADPGRGTLSYSVAVKRDVPQFSFFGIALLLLVAPAGLLTWRSISFERQRWAESDYPPTSLADLTGSSDSSDSDGK